MRQLPRGIDGADERAYARPRNHVEFYPRRRKGAEHTDVSESLGPSPSERYTCFHFPIRSGLIPSKRAQESLYRFRQGLIFEQKRIVPVRRIYLPVIAFYVICMKGVYYLARLVCREKPVRVNDATSTFPHFIRENDSARLSYPSAASYMSIARMM